LYRHIAASRLHEWSMQAVVLDFQELRHLETCSDCKALLQRFVEHQRSELEKEPEKPQDRRKSA